MTFLLDANVLIALVDSSHVHHEPASTWLATTADDFSTCPITQSALVRYLLRQGHERGRIGPALRRIQALPRHQFWPDDVPFTSDVINGITGHRQVTDSYLCHLAAARSGRVATYDRGLVALNPTNSVLVPTT